MDCLAPPLRALLSIQLNIQNGLSVHSAIRAYLQDFPDCPFARQVGLWLFCMQTGKPFTEKVETIHRKMLLDILNRGLKGQPILFILKEFEEELKQVAMQDLEEQIQKLPFLSLIPLFLFQVPAFFLLLLAPLLLELKASLGL